MAYERKDGDITLFLNKAEGNDKRPAFKGSALIDGKEYEVALWKRTSANGTNYLSGQIKLAQAKGEQPTKEQPKKDDSPFDDEIPF